jgi:hypothetical protein
MDNIYIDMASKYKHIIISEDDLRIFRKAKLEYMGYIGSSNLGDGRCAVEFSKIITSWIKKNKMESKK